MNIRQQDAATPHALKSSLKLISVSAIALMVGIGAASAQGGSARQTEHNIEKKKDQELLTPIRPLPRKVGDTSWPEPKPEAQREANERKNAPPRETTGAAPRETTGQAASSQPPQNNQPQQPTAAQNNAPSPQQNNTAQNQPTQNNAPAPQQTNTAQNQPAQSAPAAQNNTAQNQPAQSNAPEPQQNNAAQNQPAQNNQPPQNTQQANQQSQPKDEGHASIRLGTDAGGKVAINEDQERQLTTALRKARVSPAQLNVAVQVGGTVPQNVRLAAVSSDIVHVLPQFRGYSYFATANDVYIVDPAANRIVAFFPVKLTATASRTRGSAPDTAAAAMPTDTTGSVATDDRPSRKSRRTARRGDGELDGIEAAVDREMSRRGIVVRSGSNARTVVVEEEQPTTTYRVRRPWFFGGRYE